jgi:hypothetical protein
MGFLNPTSPPVDPQEFLQRPFLDRMRYLATFWADHGFGSPRVFHLIYVLKLAIFYAFGGLLVVTLTSDVGSVFHPGSWWDEPIVYEKLVLWTVLLEVLGVGGSWGPLAGHFKPMTGGVHYWLRPGTIRLPPWARTVPFTRGDTRTVGDVLLYAALLVSLVTALVLPGVSDDGLAAAMPDSTGGLVRIGALVPVIVLLVVLGLRDKVIFLAARGEQYLPALVFAATLDFTDMIIAFKLLIVAVWVGAGVSKFGEHFINVVPPMVSNAPFVPGKKIRRLHYRDVDGGDLKPSGVAWFMAHVGGTTVEVVVPLVLLFATNHTVALLAALFMVFFHLFIASTFPLAVPLEWNVLFGFITIFLFLGYPAGDGYSVFDFSQWWLLPVIVAALAFFPVLGNLRPDLVSFLPSMRQYAGNWASGTWAFAPGAEARLNELPKAAKNQVDQLQEFGFDADVSEVTMQMVCAWRSMHSQGRGLYSLLFRHLDDVDRYTIREGEFVCNTLVGWNFGDGHLHDERLVAAVQRRLGFEPGELQVMYVESQPIHKKTQEYRVIDAALGVVERGTWTVHDAVSEQPWLPDGPIPLNVTWTLPGYVPGSATGSASDEGART